MLIDITELLSVNGLKQSYTVHFERDFFQNGEVSYKVSESPDFELTITNTGSRRLMLAGRGYVTLIIPCGRCLEDVEVMVDFEINREACMDEGHSDDTDGDIEDLSYIDGYHLDVDAFVYTEILMNLPLKVLCSEDCRGLCYQCGANLNRGECGCDREQLDPRMSVIQDIFKNFKEV